MTDRPILFSAPMVRALLEGRKTQTRRLAEKFFPVKNPKAPKGTGVYKPTFWQKAKPGDRLYVRETFGVWHRGDSTPVRGQPYDPVTVYRADDEDPDIPHDLLWEPFRWRPSIHMPRWASRLTLVVTDVRQQKLKDIDIHDAAAEGLTSVMEQQTWWYSGVGKGNRRYEMSVMAYKELWEHINGPGAWDANPEVVALTFTVHNTNIDHMDQAA